jgi:hypothetical protein
MEQEALKTALRARLWDVGDRICLARPDLKKELEAARALAAEDIEVRTLRCRVPCALCAPLRPSSCRNSCTANACYARALSPLQARDHVPLPHGGMRREGADDDGCYDDDR